MAMFQLIEIVRDDGHCMETGRIRTKNRGMGKVYSFMNDASGWTPFKGL